MTRAYDVVDADGHILEPLDLWDRYIDPEFHERRPRFVIDENGKERLKVEGKMLGNPRGIGSLGSVGRMVRVESLKPLSSKCRSMRSSQGAIHPPPDSMNPMRTRGWRSQTPSQITLIAASIISIVWLIMWRAARSAAKRSTPTVGIAVVEPSWNPIEKSSSSAIVQNGSYIGSLIILLPW